LGEIDPGNQEAIAALVKLIQASQDESTRRYAAKSLGEIDPGNQEAIAALVKLIETSQDEFTRRSAAENLGKIGAGNQEAIAALVKLIGTSQDEYTGEQAAESLGKILEEAQMAAVVTALKDYLSEQTYKNNSNQYRNCYSLLWHYAQALPYPNFYQAWHQKEGVGRRQSGEENTTTPSIPTLNLAELPKFLRAAIDSDSQLRDEVQLICIDGSKFIDLDNPSIEIYDQMLAQDCPERQNGEPETMPKLMLYWNSLRRKLKQESDCLPILLFYENPTAPALQGFSERFLSDLSKFDGAIALVTDPKINFLQSFSPSQANLIADIVGWIHQVVLEH
jgi:hypothetical protein